jgi:hypothetical protein
MDVRRRSRLPPRGSGLMEGRREHAETTTMRREEGREEGGEGSVLSGGESRLSLWLSVCLDTKKAKAKGAASQPGTGAPGDSAPRHARSLLASSVCSVLRREMSPRLSRAGKQSSNQFGRWFAFIGRDPSQSGFGYISGRSDQIRYDQATSSGDGWHVMLRPPIRLIPHSLDTIPRQPTAWTF